MSFQQITVQGVICRDAELTHNSFGEPVLTMVIPIARPNKKDTDWFKCLLKGSRALKLHQYMTKGTVVLLTGQMRFIPLEKNGVKFRTHEMIVENLNLCERGQKQEKAE